MEIDGLPVHALAVHASVVLAPLAALVGLTYAATARWRWALRWPLLVAAVVAAGATGLSYLSGEDLLEQRPNLLEVPALAEKIHLHQDRAEILLWVALGYVVLAAAAAWALGGPSALASGGGARETKGVWGVVALVALVAGSVALLVLTFLTGEAGARAVWG
ncbi:DUF2231 domain-containing protein [Nocardioides pacificus]